MLHDILFFLLGIIRLVIGSNYLTDGAVSVARRFKVSNMVIGLTVVAICNSLPDLVTSVTATLKGETSLAFVNIVGSCIINILVALGAGALLFHCNPELSAL